MIDFGTWTKASASAYRDTYAVGVPVRAAWLGREVEASGGAAASLDGPGGLDRLWAWVVRRFEEEGATGLTLVAPLPDDDPQAGRRPPWHDPARANPYLSDGALWLIEGLGCHLAMLTMHACPQARWELYRAPSSTRDVNQNRTMLHDLPKGTPSDPSSMVYSQVIRTTIHDEPWAADALGMLYRYLTASEVTGVG
jgi:hypothetical protein